MRLRAGCRAPDFEQDSTEGLIRLHAWMGEDWCVLFSYIRDFAPACAVQVGMASKLKADFDCRRAKMLALGTDTVLAHTEWIGDIEATERTTVNLPMLGDTDHRVCRLYGLAVAEADGVPTERAIFIIDPDKIIRAQLSYAADRGQDFAEVLRLIDALQKSDNGKQVASL